MINLLLFDPKPENLNNKIPQSGKAEKNSPEALVAVLKGGWHTYGI